MAFEFSAHDLLFEAMEAERRLTCSKNRWTDEARALDEANERDNAAKQAVALRLLLRSPDRSTRGRAGNAIHRVAKFVRPWATG